MGGPMVGDGADDERDRQATVTDFLDYTEHLPADIERSLTLLREQDELAQAATEQLHRLLQQYAQLATDHDAYESAQMRREIAYLLDLIRRRRESAAAEAHRLNDETVRHHKRLQNVKAKLLALPQPPSRDPTPQPTQKSPQARRNESIRLSLKAADSHMRSALPKRRMIIPGEVLPPWNPDSPASSDYDEMDDEPEDDEEDDDELVVATATLPSASSRKKEKPPKIPKMHRPPKEPKIPKEPKPRKEKPPKLPGQVGTNVHSSVAGISTSNALSLLTPPPENAKPGSKFAPWFRLTEWEMATLRKRMKKNAIWAPSDTMIRRELVDKGRGHEAYQRAKRLFDETGEPILDEDDVEGQLSGQRELRPGEISADTKTKAAVTLNKGMDLNVRKKEKKIMMAQQQAALAAQQNTDLANQSLATLSQSFRTLFDRPPDASPSTPGTDASTVRGGGYNKRKRESGISPSAQDLQLQAQLLAEGSSSNNAAGTPTAKPTPKKAKATAGGGVAGSLAAIAPATPKMMTTTTTTTIPTAPPAASPAKQGAGAGTKIEPGSETTATTAGNKKTGASSNSQVGRRMSLTLHMPRADSKAGGGSGGSGGEPSSSGGAGATARETRQSSRPSSARASAGPMDASGNTTANSSSITRQSPRLKSATPGPTPTATTSSHTFPSTNNTTATTTSSTTTTGPTAQQTAGAQRERRSKRPAPGPVSASYQDGGGGPVVASGRRKNAPKKKGKLNVEEGRKQEEWLDEEVDPNEPRYCVCNNVSYGTMIQCENAGCEGGEWFHLECVKLREPPGRRDKWWCPKCDPNKG